MVSVAWGHWSSNLGDVAVTTGAIRLLRHVGVEPKIVRWARQGPERFDGAECFDVPVGKIVYGGGEHLYSYRWLRKRLEHVPGVVLPSTFGPFAPDDEDLIRSITGPVAARDPVSAGIMSNILGREVPVLPDPAIMLCDGQPSFDGPVVFAPRRDDVGMRMKVSDPGRPVEDTMAFETYRGRLDGVTDGLLVAHAESDIGLCEVLSERVGVPWVRPDTVDGLVEIYRTCKSVVTSRFHAAIFARAYGKQVETIPFSAHGHKMLGVTETVMDRETLIDWVADALG